jgi:hypothetical protein
MQPAMVTECANQQILIAIIRFVPIDVVDTLPKLQPSPKGFLCN